MRAVAGETLGAKRYELGRCLSRIKISDHRLQLGSGYLTQLSHRVIIAFAKISDAS